jgi:hypothetical protein
MSQLQKEKNKLSLQQYIKCTYHIWIGIFIVVFIISGFFTFIGDMFQEQMKYSINKKEDVFIEISKYKTDKKTIYTIIKEDQTKNISLIVYDKTPQGTGKINFSLSKEKDENSYKIDYKINGLEHYDPLYENNISITLNKNTLINDISNL